MDFKADMKIKIRPMKQTDIEKVYAIEKASHRMPWPSEILSDCVLVGYDCRVLELVEKTGRELVGYVICRSSLTVCHILNLCVSPESQGKGYGSQLLTAVLETLKSNQSISSAILEVRPSNLAAIALYEKFGFQHDAIKADYYEDTDGREDAILLKKIIKH